MKEHQLKENIAAIESFRKLMEINKNSLTSAATDDTWITFSANTAQLSRGLATLKYYHKHASSLLDREPLGGIAIFSSYNDPLFGTVGMSLGAALMINGRKRPILLKFPNVLKKLTSLFAKILKESGEFPNIAISSLDGKAFMDYCFQSPDYGVVQVYGGPWVWKYAGHAKQNNTALRFEGPGNNPAIIDASANLEDAVDMILGMSYVMSGQACVAINRLLIDDRINKTKFNSLLEEKLKAIRCSEDISSDVHVGPLKNTAVITRLKEQIDEAKLRGARPFNLTMKEYNSGLLITPSLFFETDHNMRIVKEETFGPVLSIQYASRDKLVELADSTEYGLTANVFGNLDETKDIVGGLNKTHGMVLVNQTSNEAVSLNEGYIGPWGGYGISSFYLGPDTQWNLTKGPMYLWKNFTREVE